MDTVLVLGAGGTTGRRLVDQLNHQRLVTVRTAGRRDGLDVRFDWDDPGTWDAAVAGAQAVYVVPPALRTDPSDQVSSFLDLAGRSGTTRAVLVSSLGVTFPGEPADSGRRRTERAVRESGLRWTIARPSGFMQNLSEGFLAGGVAQGTILSATANGRVPLVDAGDIAGVAAVALTTDTLQGRVAALTGPAALSFEEATAIISRRAGRPVAHRSIGGPALSDLLVGFGLPADYVEMLVRDQLAIAEGHAASVSADVPGILGRAATGFEDFAATTPWPGPAPAGDG